MTPFGFIILYVNDPSQSAAFYADLLAVPPAEQSAAFAVFAFPTGVKLGLWSRHAVQPPPGAAAGAIELAFPVGDADATFRDWSARGLTIVQPPTTMDFGRTFVALDPDGHRLRVLTPGAS